jgi:hypothetical protein
MILRGFCVKIVDFRAIFCRKYFFYHTMIQRGFCVKIVDFGAILVANIFLKNHNDDPAWVWKRVCTKLRPKLLGSFLFSVGVIFCTHEDNL